MSSTILIAGDKLMLLIIVQHAKVKYLYVGDSSYYIQQNGNKRFQIGSCAFRIEVGKDRKYSQPSKVKAKGIS